MAVGVPPAGAEAVDAAAAVDVDEEEVVIPSESPVLPAQAASRTQQSAMIQPQTA
ncbi:MAG TPA: hypothetical protein VGP82_10920 [Ktedonobacterales bacterium]|nr:hypothetical protein [Ktedonobacterales bacterium]